MSEPSERDREMAFDLLDSYPVTGVTLQDTLGQAFAAARAEGRREADADRTERDGILFREGEAKGRRQAIEELRNPPDDFLESQELARITLASARAIHSSSVPAAEILSAYADYLSRGHTEPAATAGEER